MDLNISDQLGTEKGVDVSMQMFPPQYSYFPQNEHIMHAHMHVWEHTHKHTHTECGCH